MNYNQSPLEAANAKNLNLRTPHKVTVRWLFFPVRGKKYRAYLTQKEHVEQQIKWLAMMSTDELFRVKQAIVNGKVPSFFAQIIDEIYFIKNKGQHVIELSIGDNVSPMPLFEYENQNSWNLPKDLSQTQQEKPGTVLVPKIKPKISPTKIPQSVLDILKTKG